MIDSSSSKKGIKCVDVLIVDDSSVYRNLLKMTLSDEAVVNVIGSVADGAEALEFIKHNSVPDIVTLDLEMPRMNGITTLQEIQKINKKIVCIMVSAFTRSGSEETIKALEMGAYDFVTKPQGGDARENMASLKRQVMIKVHAIIAQMRLSNVNNGKVDESQLAVPKKKVSTNVKAVLIGCSTGGPKALIEVLPSLCDQISLPIFIVQHMPATFTESFSKMLNGRCSHKVVEAKDGQDVEDNHVYVAPGDYHMVIRENVLNKYMIALNQQPPEQGCRPAVDVMFRSAAAVFKSSCVACVLTGMGADGTRGLGALQRAGAFNIAQDEQSSVVWGMPGAAVEAGHVHKVLPLKDIAKEIASRC